MKKMLVLLTLLFLSSPIVAEDDFEQCLLQKVKNLTEERPVEKIHQACRAEVEDRDNRKLVKKLGGIGRRIKAERKAENNRHMITAHKPNYLLPITQTDAINRGAYEVVEPFANELKDSEAKLQLSIKVPLNSADILTKNDGLYFGFTIQSWWQVYTDNLSSPFRETNYQPEIYYMTGLDWQPFGGNTGLLVGIEHQSNGQSQLLSRSWNRIYANLLFEQNNFAFSFRSWYRIPEDEKEFLLDSAGDDNPDIHKYMGYFELGMAYRYENFEYSFMGRNNLMSENRGAVQLGMSFPLYGHLRGFVQYFNGYGESLIDYNYSQERFGIGILLTDFL